MAYNIETPASVQRKLDALRNAFAQLVETFSTDKQLIAIAREYDTWHYKASESLLSKIFVSSIAAEYESWQRRYIEQYRRLVGENPGTKTIAPSPDVIIEPSKTSPWLWVAIGATVVFGTIGAVVLTKR